MKKFKGIDIARFSMLSAFIGLAVICIICQFACFKFSIEGLVNCIIIVVLCAILSFISNLVLKAYKKNIKETESKNENTNYSLNNARNVDDYINKLEGYEKTNVEYCREIIEIRSKFFSLKRLKLIAYGFLGFIVSGIMFVPLLVLGIKSVNEINSDKYIKTQAVVRKVYYDANKNSSILLYSYTTEDGKIFTSKNGPRFGGAIFKPGKTVTVYYEASAPENSTSLSNVFMLFVGASFALTVGIGLVVNGFLGNTGSALGVVICLTFLEVSLGLIAGVFISGGLSIFETLGSGILTYICCCFSFFGVFLLAVLAYANKYHKKYIRKIKKLSNKK